MKKIFLLLFMLISTSLFSSNIDFTEEEKSFIKNSPKIKIASMDTYTPFSFIQNGKKIGFTQDLIKIISKKSGLKFEKIGGPWPKVYKLFQDGKVDIITEISYRKSRESFTSFSDAYYEVPIGVFTRKEFGTYRSLNDLKDKKIGVIQNTYITEIFKKENLDFVEFDKANERFRALDNGEIDVVISNALNMHKVEELMLSNIKLAGTFIHPDTKKEDLRFGVRKENPLLSSIINKTLNSISFSVMSELKENWIFTLDTPKSYNKLTDKERDWIVKNKVNIGIEEAKPYIYFDKSKDINSGLYFDVLKKVIKNTGLKVNYTNSPWPILLEDFKKEKIDLLPAAFYSKDREKIGHFSNEYYKVREYIYVSDKNNDIKNFRDLKGKKVAVTKDYVTIKKIKNKFPEINIRETKGLQESITKLLNKEVDALVDYHLVVENYIRDNSIIGLKDISQNDFEAISVHFLSNIKKPILKSILNKGLSDISREEMGGLLKNWVRNPYNSKKEEFLSTKEIEFIKKHKKIRFGIRTNRPPFVFYENNKASGIAVDYVKKSAENMGLEAEFVYEKMSIIDSYKMLENREIFDTVLFTIKNEENEKRFSMGDAYLSYPMMIIKHKNSSYIGSMKDLFNKTVVLEKAFDTNKWIKRDYPSIKIVNVANTVDALKYINEGKADAYIGNLAISNYLSVFGGLDNLKVAAPSGYGNINYHFVAPKEWPELASILSKGFKQISPVEHSAIQQKWFSLQTIEKVDYSLLWKIVLVLLLIIIWILWWNRKLKLEKEKTNKALVELEEIRRKELESKNKLLQVKEQFNRFFHLAINIQIISTTKGIIKELNNASKIILGYENDELIGKKFLDFVHPDDIESTVEEMSKLSLGKNVYFFENRYIHKDGHVVNLLWSATTDDSNNLIYATAQDITNLKRIESEQKEKDELLYEQTKLASMGEMIGNIAHQWRQPLSIISTGATGMKTQKEYGLLSDDIFNDTCDAINNNAQYLSRTIDDFRNFIKGDRSKKVFNLADDINSFLHLVEGTIKTHHIKIIKDVQEDIKINGYSNELIQCFINIFNNAKYALEENDNKLIFFTTLIDKDNVIIKIKDNGGGIDKKILYKVFEPYFTTKHQSKGTGLGLHITYKLIVKGMNGTIKAQNTEYKYNGKSYVGAEFIITLPIK
ncbi:transporter substrate-binding domain-containing protein [Poseidonibacter ostreae]|uniref:histidine kinase n=1 Tax=Poseidonibacter ostreae TaxID=2654171 RepID=A0ABQ6VH98_9BACT|nr:transporter substrate-binding domain-containing protein [Poseidonibacter ostreae]KAB7884470.1 transporter substrate-binding domain-containing protein [Poseidonibacter ostreae]KAB7886214.1 transporter substrate-binding domain-containing protein [Poseidonibacter ostreae]